jgi:hypothetical protein
MDYKGRSHCHYDPMRFHRVCEKEGFSSEMYYIADSVSIFLRKFVNKAYFHNTSKHL